MKARWIMIALGLAMLLTAKGITAAEEASKEKKKFAATCPVSGKPAGEDHVVERKNGGRTEKIYFCCDNCPKAYKEDPKKFRLQVNRQLLETGQMVQVACPLTGKPINKEAKAEAGEAEVHFCCKNCLAKYNDASNEEKLQLVFSPAALKKGFTKQTKCPVSGKDINPEEFTEYEGQKVYFCCPNCKAAFEKDPAKFADKLPKPRNGGNKEKKGDS
jgi:YHS domain-containing protein